MSLAPDQIQHSAGGVVVHRGRLLLIEARHSGRWQLPKGHLEPGETAQQAAIREVREETGAAVTVLGPAGRVDYGFRDQRGRWIEKHVDFYLCAFAHQASERCDPREVRRAAWHGWERALELLAFDNERDLVRRSLERLAGGERRELLQPSEVREAEQDGRAADRPAPTGHRRSQGPASPSTASTGDRDGPEEIP